MDKVNDLVIVDLLRFKAGDIYCFEVIRSALFDRFSSETKSEELVWEVI